MARTVRHKFAIWLYYRLDLGVRDVEDLVAERNILVTYEAIRLWMKKFGRKFAGRFKKKAPGFGYTYLPDEVLIKINGKQHHLWLAVDQDGQVVDLYLRERRDARTAKRFLARS